LGCGRNEIGTYKKEFCFWKKKETRANKNNSGRACWMWPDLLPAAPKEEGEEEEEEKS
jgi:hypothetical protein